MLLGLTTGYKTIERVIRYSYENGRMVSQDGPRGDINDTTSFVWDDKNRMTEIRIPGHPIMRIREFDSMGRAIVFQKGEASPTTVTYNDMNQIQSVTQWGLTLSLIHDAEGRLTGVRNRVGREMKLAYDEVGQLVSIEYVGGQKITQQYDQEGKLIGQTLMDQYGSFIRSVNTLYDVQERVASVSRAASVAGLANLKTTADTYEYDQFNRATLATNQANGKQLALAYDSFGNLEKIDGPNGKNVNWGYDARGQRTSFSDNRDNVTEFIQDDFGRMVAFNNADVGLSLFEYDAADNPIVISNAAGSVTTYRWDSANRPILIRSDDGDTRFEYDPITGKLAHTSNPASAEHYAYDVDGRLLQHTRLLDQHEFVTKYGYGQQGRLVSKTLPNGQLLRYHYYQDGVLNGQLRAITRATLFGLSDEILVAEIDEDPSDGITGYVAHNGLRTTRFHGIDGRVTRIEVSNSLRFEYSYDHHGQIIGIDLNGLAQSFSYTKGLLSYANVDSREYVINYDSAANRTSQVVTESNGEQSRTKYLYSEQGEGNQLLAMGEESDHVLESVHYNVNGSPLTRGELRYEYNNGQRPIKVFKNDRLLAEYSYNTFGERIKKVVYANNAKKVTYFLYESHQLVAEITDPSTSTFGKLAQTIYLNGHPIVQLIDKNAYAIHSDRLGTPQLLTGDAREHVWQAEYTPFGKANVFIDDISFKLRLPGHYPEHSGIGETTTEFHTYYSCYNWIGFQYVNGKCSYSGDWRLLVTDTEPEFYHAAVDGYEKAKKHFKEYKALHYVSKTPDKNGEFFDSNRPRPLVEQLGGECYDSNWANMGNFNITRYGSWFEMYNGELEEKQKIRPLTQDGRPFEYIGFINADYYNMNERTDYTWTHSLLFYDPVSKISLITFDWS